MDRKFSEKSEIERLIQVSHTARCCLENQANALKHQLDIPARFRSSVKHHPTGWLVGLLTSGLTAGLMFRRKSVVREQKRRSLPLAFLGLTLTAVRPFAKVWLTGQVKNYLAGQLGRSPAGRIYPAPTDSDLHPQNPLHAIRPSGS